MLIICSICLGLSSLFLGSNKKSLWDYHLHSINFALNFFSKKPFLVILSLPARRIGLCWEATRAPKLVTEAWGAVVVPHCPFSLYHAFVPNALNPRGFGGQSPPQALFLWSIFKWLFGHYWPLHHCFHCFKIISHHLYIGHFYIPFSCFDSWVPQQILDTYQIHIGIQ